MATSKKPRKAGKRIVRNPREWVDNMTSIPAADIIKIKLVTRFALDNVRKGLCSEYDFNALAAVTNTQLVLAESGIGGDALDKIKAAQNALLDAQHRFDVIGRYGFDGRGLVAVTDALDIHDQQIDLCTKGEYSRALQGVYARMNAGEVLIYQEA
jgi:hypothetical protein